MGPTINSDGFEESEAPGLEDSPPISSISAPSFSNFLECANDASIDKNLPPSLKESGVTFTIPMTKVLWPCFLNQLLNC